MGLALLLGRLLRHTVLLQTPPCHLRYTPPCHLRYTAPCHLRYTARRQNLRRPNWRLNFMLLTHRVSHRVSRRNRHLPRQLLSYRTYRGHRCLAAAKPAQAHFLSADLRTNVRRRYSVFILQKLWRGVFSTVSTRWVLRWMSTG